MRLEELAATCRQCIVDNHYWVNQWAWRPTTVPHIFGDIVEQVPRGSFDKSLPFADRRQQILDAPLATSQYCYAHGSRCSILQQSDVDMSGLPCQDNSRANFKRRFFEGPNGTCYAVWGKKHSELKTPLIILENTPDAKAFN